MHIYIYIYIHTHTHTHTHLMYVYVCIYTYTYISTRSRCNFSYSRATFGQTGDGHWSPVGGYHAELDMVGTVSRPVALELTAPPGAPAGCSALQVPPTLGPAAPAVRVHAGDRQRYRPLPRLCCHVEIRGSHQPAADCFSIPAGQGLRSPPPSSSPHAPTLCRAGVVAPARPLLGSQRQGISGVCLGRRSQRCRRRAAEHHGDAADRIRGCACSNNRACAPRRLCRSRPVLQPLRHTQRVCRRSFLLSRDGGPLPLWRRSRCRYPLVAIRCGGSAPVCHRTARVGTRQGGACLSV